MTTLVPALVAEAERRYDRPLELGATLAGGEEACAVAVRSAGSRLVLRVSPPWRTFPELAWAYELAAWAARAIPEVVAPLPTSDDAVAFQFDGQVVSLFPFVEGKPLDRADQRERDAAAALLARLHRVLPAWPNPRPRPPADPGAPVRTPAAEPEGLADPALDARLRDLAARHAAALAHGDYYRGNLRCVDRRIVGLFDWDDARTWTLEDELAWSVWEFAQADMSAALDLDRARRFLDAYAAAGGPVPVDDRSFVIPLIRADLAEEVREARAAEEQGRWYDPEYTARAFAAFTNLRHQTL